MRVIYCRLVYLEMISRYACAYTVRSKYFYGPKGDRQHTKLYIRPITFIILLGVVMGMSRRVHDVARLVRRAERGPRRR